MTTHRFDAVASLALAAALVFAFAGRPGLSGVALGVGMLTKLVPAVAILPLGMYFLHQRRPRELVRVAVAGAITVAVGWSATLLTVGSSCLDVFSYHGGRPLEIESTGALLLRLIGGASVIATHGSVNVVSPWSASMMSLSRVALVGFALATLALTWRRMAAAQSEDERRLSVVTGTVVLLAMLMACSPVFSPQYVVWLLPIALVVAARTDRAALIGLLAVCLLTQAVYPTMFQDLCRGDWLPLAVTLGRNATMFWLAWHLLARPAFASAPGRSLAVG